MSHFGGQKEVTFWSPCGLLHDYRGISLLSVALRQINGFFFLSPVAALHFRNCSQQAPEQKKVVVSLHPFRRLKVRLQKRRDPAKQGVCQCLTQYPLTRNSCENNSLRELILVVSEGCCTLKISGKNDFSRKVRVKFVSIAKKSYFRLLS